MKVVINACYGGFDISEEGLLLYAKLKGFKIYIEKSGKSWGDIYWLVPENKRVKALKPAEFAKLSLKKRQEYNKKWAEQTIYGREIPRDDPFLIQVVEKLGEKAGGNFSKLKVVEVPDGVDWEIQEYDGFEHIAEKHRTWG